MIDFLLGVDSQLFHALYPLQMYMKRGFIYSFVRISKNIGKEGGYAINIGKLI